MCFPLDATAVAAIDLAWVNELIEEQREHSKAISAATGLADVTIPKVTKMNWTNVKTALIEKLSRLRGGYNIPLTYVIRPADGTYDSMEDKLIDCAQHNGAKFRMDNNQVFSILNETFDGTIGTSFVDTYKRSKNGRAAYLALVNHYESSTQTKQKKNAAYDSMRKAQYDGSKKRFTLREYHVIHANAHATIAGAKEEAGSTPSLTNDVKIQLFQNGLRCNRAIEESTRTNQQLSQNANPPTFEEYYQNMSSVILAVSDMSTRQMRTFSSSGEGNARNLAPMRSESRPPNRGGRSGRGGRFNSRGRGHHGRGGRHAPYESRRFTPRSTAYSNDE